MNLLILTQKVDINDDVLGFFHDWISEFAKNCEKVIVVCLYRGEYDLPANVEVLSLGKETRKSRVKYLLNFYKYIWQKRKEYDKVFVHMNPEYVLLGGLLWRLWGKKINLWYTHKQISLVLKIAEKISDKIYTASKESFQLPSKKIQIIGHGINFDNFKGMRQEEMVRETEKFVIIYVGRISKIKNQELLIRAIDELVNRKKINNLEIKIIGAPVYEKDKEYKKDLERYIQEKDLSDYIKFIGSVPNKEISKYYAEADLSVNLCPTGGADKAVLESMAGATPVIALNQTFSDDLGFYKDELIIKKDSDKELAQKILNIKSWEPEKKEELSQFLRGVVEDKHNLKKLIKIIISNKK